MTKLKDFLQTSHAPLALLLTCLAAFGLLSPALGFFQDDWHFIFYAQHGLDKLWELSAYDNRPFASWPYIAGFALFGFRPLTWQIGVLLVRWLTAVAFWLVFRSLWPRHARLAVVPALLFAVYPLYTLQPMAVTYLTHWVAYLLYALSLWLMILAVRDIQRLWPLLILSVALDGLQLFTIEYFNGIELLRPIILWMALSAPQADSRSRFKSVTCTWLPYLSVLAAFVFWRGFVFQSPAADNNAPTVLRDLVSAPLPTLIYLVTAGLKDTLLIQIGAWSETLTPALVDFSPAGLAILFASALGFVGFYFYFKQLDLEEAAPVQQMLLLGALGLILGPIPAWVTRQPLYDTNPLWNSRLGMAAMFGAGLVIVALVEWLARTKHQRVIVYSLLLALSIGHLLRSENNYRHAWEAQVDFINQLAWRAPSIQAGTAFVSEGELLSYMGDYPTAFAVNMIYNQPKDSTQTPTWFFPSYGDDVIAEKMLSGGTLREIKFSTRFEGNAADSLIIWYEPTVSACLHILTPLDAESRLYSDYLRQLAPRSALERISQESNVNTDFFAQALTTFKGWCYYYQKAELAEQYGQSAHVIEFWKTAQGQELHPSHGMEYLPFIRAYLSTGDFTRAQALTESANHLTSSQAMRQTLCHPWLEVGETGAGPRSEVWQLLKCE
ncbi:MAG: hypothetical protein HY869_05125 [Chloroflexi bacterium]|nr:hypothetical protein [Chloroflexota bacterium]